MKPGGPLAKISKKRLEQLGFMPSTTFTPKTPRTPLGLRVSGGEGSAVPGQSPAASKTTKKGLRALGGGLRTRLRSTGPDANTVEPVLERDHWSCAWCGGELFGDRGTGWSIGHRRPRRSGGDRRPDTNLPSNLVALHGSGTSGCHGEIERERSHAEFAGFLLTATAKPHEHKIRHAIYGWCWLDDKGGIGRNP